jgi:hypothetical protein
MNASSAFSTVMPVGEGSAASASISRAFFPALSQARVRALTRTSDHEMETRRALVTRIAKGQSFTLYQPEPILSGGIL